MSDADLHSGRSNSFRRMLELERAYMIERLQAKGPQPQPPPHSSTAKPATRPRRATETSDTQTRRSMIRLQNPSHRRETSSPAHRAPVLVIDTSPSAMGPRTASSIPQRDSRAAEPASSTASSAVSKTVPRVITSPTSPQLEPDQKSICVSPSWEAQSRRRKEKKLEKKEKEEAAKMAQAKGRKSRLSKQPPPPSSADALKRVDNNGTDRGRGQDRSSTAGVKSPEQEAPPRKPRSRSSSFASLIRSPLGGFRRASQDQSSESEFIGGIKLEFERHLANEKTLDQQAKGDETAAHPALRTEKNDKKTHRLSEPLRSPPPPGRSLGDAKDSTRRAYPPITRLDKTAKTRSLISPTAPAIPDISTIDKWRVRVGLKPSSQPPTPTSAEPVTQVTEPSDNADVKRPAPLASPGGREATFEVRRVELSKSPSNILGPTSHSGLPSKVAPDAEERPKGHAAHIAFAQDPQIKTVEAESAVEPESSNADTESVRPNSRGRPSTGYRTAPSTPPDPPQRSPRRSSIPRSEDHAPPVPPSRDAREAPRLPIFSEYSTTEKASKLPPSLAEPASPSTLQPRMVDKLNAALASYQSSRELVRRPLSPSYQAAEIKRQKSPTDVSSSTRSRTWPLSSPEESCSDDLQSPSPPSTPATSRSESEKGMPSLGHVMEGTAPAGDRPRHDAGDKVLTVHRGGHSRNPNVDGRNDLPSQKRSATRERPASPRNRSLNSPQRSFSRGSDHISTGSDQPREQSPQPVATNYVDEVRRQPPTAPSSRTAKQRLGPPASFALPGDMIPLRSRAELARPSESSARLSQYSGPAPTDREPIAKVFVECCKCKFYHDMPSNLYEAMANPEAALSGRDTMGYASSISMTVKCPWCRHDMSTRCCAGLAAMVYVTERLH
ncbi:hypothetical protein HIM_06834 [Hirsutella minnesotensis 3608]|uniref:Uncharacterized protein n=1 Tax=Hirsutella minnesotensis 3608 TaxID=1043627 RepID=A0A0F7ZII0_9HYPO|nr:hypothetical protein HIM_06834 [Hirsutella minnesotensis 3608]